MEVHRRPNPRAEGRDVSVYRKIYRGIVLDMYRIWIIFGVTHPCLQHATKKIFFPGMRKSGKTALQDIDEAIASLQRWKEMQQEDAELKGEGR